MTRRNQIVLGSFFFWFCILVVRLVWVQAFQHGRFAARARAQHIGRIELQIHRGLIRDRNGQIVAMNRKAYSLYIQPIRIVDLDRVVTQLQPFVDLDRSRVQEAAVRNPGFLWLSRGGLEEAQARAIEKLQLTGVHVIPTEKRVYPHGERAGSVIGFVGVDNQGLAGLEYKYDAYLKGDTLRLPVLLDAWKRTLWIPRERGMQTTQNAFLDLSMDLYAQHEAERVLNQTIARTRAKRGLIVGMDPYTGEILFHAQYPPFDPNRYREQYRDPWRWQVGSVHWVLEPGSTFKPVFAAMALMYNPKLRWQQFDGGHGRLDINGVRIRDHRPFDRLKFDEILIYSSNVGAARLGLLLPPPFIARAYQQWGFGRKTQVDMTGEQAGLVRPWRRWAPIDPAYQAFGQGIAVTPMQLLRFYAAIANGGYGVTPRFARTWIDRQGRAHSLVEKRTERILPSNVVAVLRDILERVVREGSGKAAAIPGYRVAGKTGTAQKPSPTGGYQQGRYLASFVGFFPVAMPRVVIYVMVDEPQGKYYGQDVAAPAFRDLAMALARLWHIAPDRRAPTDVFAGIDRTSRDTKPAPVLRVAWSTSWDALRWPDLRGRTVTAALRWARQYEIQLVVHGRGNRIRFQLPYPGSRLTIRTGIVWLELPKLAVRPFNEAAQNEHTRRVYADPAGNLPPPARTEFPDPNQH